MGFTTGDKGFIKRPLNNGSASTDYNDYRKAGRYKLSSVSTFTNAPPFATGCDFIVLEYIEYDATHGIQIATTADKDSTTDYNKEFRRCYESGTWTEWAEVQITNSAEMHPKYTSFADSSTLINTSSQDLTTGTGDLLIIFNRVGTSNVDSVNCALKQLTGESQYVVVNSKWITSSDGYGIVNVADEVNHNTVLSQNFFNGLSTNEHTEVIVKIYDTDSGGSLLYEYHFNVNRQSTTVYVTGYKIDWT